MTKKQIYYKVGFVLALIFIPGTIPLALGTLAYKKLKEKKK